MAFSKNCLSILGKSQWSFSIEKASSAGEIACAIQL
jgi:hypothetical protein